jgi:hypothetical protein
MLAPQDPQNYLDSGTLHDQAKRCRRLAESTYDRETSKMLRAMADGFERSADELAQRRA